ncbi:MAG TPA: class I lanthipeptide [Thermoanaerobaculia bacterium]|jgi:hypothetical protein|nr:class I lanthipeptide [Thermoanaerobaculia bacterium]
MKKSLKTRLTLNRETLRALDAEETSGAQGGSALTANCTISVAPSILAACVTQTCPTRCGQTYCFHV